MLTIDVRYHPLRFLILLLVLCGVAPLARALDPAIGIDGYRHDRWGEVEGAPRLVDALAQTEDGWLWVASRQAGLFRFDGVRFIPFETRDGSRLQHRSISALRAGPGNSLWIGHGAGGVSVLRAGRLSHLLAPADTGSIYTFAFGADGTAWAATGRGLYRFRAGRPERIGAAQGYDGNQARYVLADRAGRIWAADDVALYVLDAGAASFRRVRAVRPDPLLLEAPDGSVWIVLGKQFERVAPAGTRGVALPAARGSSFQSAFDDDGNLWSGNCPVGLCVLRPGVWRASTAFSALQASERLDQGWQMTSLSVLSVLHDREGSLWVGTSAGLERLRDQPVHMVGALFDRGKVHALPYPDGGILVLEASRLTGKLGLWRLRDGVLAPLPNPLGAQVIARAPDGSVLLAGSGGIERRRGGRVQRIPLPPVALPPGATIQFRDLFAGTDEVWAIVSGAGLFHYRDGRWTLLEPAGKASSIMAVDGAGGAWLGYRGNRLRHVAADRVREYGAADGLDVGRVQFIHAGEPLLVMGDAGSQVLRAGRFHALRFDVPGGIGRVSGIATGADGTRWLNAVNGLYRVAAADWARTMADPAVPLRGTLYDALDGYLGGAEALWLSDTAFAAPDGRIWFAGERGLGWIDPRTLQPNPAVPDAAVLELASASGSYRPLAMDAPRPLELGTGAADVRIDYTSPSLRQPQRVTFRYRLRGADAAWEDAGTRRSAFYKHLGPGEYTFEVVAVNESGVASRTPGTLRFVIAPRWTQTPWFYAACAAAALALLSLAYRLRMRRLAARLEERFLVRTRERESVARALHDTFLQSVQGLLLSMHSVTMKLPADSRARAEFEQLLQRAEDVLVEGRDEVKGLRGAFASSADFWQVLLRDVALIVPSGPARVRLLQPEGIDRLQPRLRHDVYAIVREAVANALRHTMGGVTVETVAAARALTVCVTDEGGGLGDFADGKPGHFGLTGMRERAAQIGARLQLAPAAGARAQGAGTRVVLTIPAALAYAEYAAPAHVGA